MAKRPVRLTLNPRQVVWVEGPEYVDLLRQGLIVRDPLPERRAPGIPAPRRPVDAPPPVPPADQTQEAPEPPEPVSAPAETARSKSRRATRRAGNRNQEK